MRDDGAHLNDDEIAELHAYRRMGVTPPERYAGVVMENTRATGIVWRWPTKAEIADADARLAAQVEALAAETALHAKIDAEIAKRAAPPPPPAPPKSGRS